MVKAKRYTLTDEEVGVFERTDNTRTAANALINRGAALIGGAAAEDRKNWDAIFKRLSIKPGTPMMVAKEDRVVIEEMAAPVPALRIKHLELAEEMYPPKPPARKLGKRK